MKELWIDCETTGTDPVRHGLHQVSGIIIVPDRDHELFDFRFKPHEDADFSMKAFTETGTSLKEVYGRPISDYQAWVEFKGLLAKYVSPYEKKNKFVMLGYNVRFDYDFIRAWASRYDKYGIGSFVWFPPVDVMTIAMVALGDKRPELENFKQVTVAKALGISVDESRLHESDYDIMLTHAIHNESMCRLIGA